ncbi:MAG: hypothetical protein IRZ05_03470, partial [Micromonosporaceae bacterium]|nr:hypothetical protein [Micromonosporaceae bacterium]
LVVPVLAGALLLSGTNAAQAASATPSRAAIEAKALETSQAVAKSLRSTGSAVFTGADGIVHRLTLSGDTLVVDGQAGSLAARNGAPAQTAGWWCNVKVGAAIAAITTVGAVAILVFISGLPATTLVSIAGLTFTAGQWANIAAIVAAGGSLVGTLQALLC